MIRFAPQAVQPSAAQSRAAPIEIAAEVESGGSAALPMSPMLLPELDLAAATVGKAAKPRSARKPKAKPDATAVQLDLTATPPSAA